MSINKITDIAFCHNKLNTVVADDISLLQHFDSMQSFMLRSACWLAFCKKDLAKATLAQHFDEGEITQGSSFIVVISTSGYILFCHNQMAYNKNICIMLKRRNIYSSSMLYIYCLLCYWEKECSRRWSKCCDIWHWMKRNLG
jgi:hypothetical protein